MNQSGRNRFATGRLFINCGDPNGIGSEVTIKAIAALPEKTRKRVVLAGSMAVLDDTNHRLGEPLTFIRVQSVKESHRGRGIPVIEPDASKGFQPVYGQISVQAGKISGAGIVIGVQACLAGDTAALITAPSCKEALHTAGYRYPGQTEMISELAQARRSIMILTAGSRRVGMVTTHLALKDVSDALDRTLIYEKLSIFRDTLTQWFGIDNPRIAVAALNPHASDGGIFGDEEETRILPAIVEARRRKMRVDGPFPADTLFPRWETFDGILAMYHDQGMIPIKMAGFGQAVNITGGLPFPRTSPDHGTAFDIAGKMVADPGSMKKAIETAAQITGRISPS